VVGISSFILLVTLAEDVFTNGVGVYNDLPAFMVLKDSIDQLINMYNNVLSQTQIQQNILKPCY